MIDPIRARQFVETQVWWIAFQRVPNPRWWERIMSPGGYHHVVALGLVNGGFVGIEWQVEGCFVTPLSEKQFDAGLAHAIENSLVVVKTAPNRRPARRRLRFGLMYCVPLVEQVLRMRSRALTPSGLLRNLLADGASVVSDGDGVGNFRLLRKEV